MLDEATGRLILKEAFEAQGFQIVENYILGGLELDGYDPGSQVGYEYSTAEDGVDLKEVEQLLAQHPCQLFVIDEAPDLDAQALLSAVFQFFRELENR